MTPGSESLLFQLLDGAVSWLNQGCFFFQKNNWDVLETKEPAAFLNCSILDLLGWTVRAVGAVLDTVGRSAVSLASTYRPPEASPCQAVIIKDERVSRKQTERAG